MDEILKGKVAIVTGAAGHLGQAVTKQFERAGAHLVLFDRGRDRLQELYPDWKGSADHLLLGSIDLTDQATVNAGVTKVVERFGRIDILVNAAGGFRAGSPVHETPDDSWKFMLNLNAGTVMNTARAVIPHMLEHSYGKVVNIGARPGLKGPANMGAYAASKSAVMRLTESLDSELKHEGINVNAIIPGTLDTPPNREQMPDANHDRWVSVESIAKVILFLVRDEASAIHGAVIPVFGTG